MNGNGKPWGIIREVNAPCPVARPSEYEELYQELLLRLEKTARNKALAVPFACEKDAQRARRAIQELLRKRRGSGYVVFRVVAEADGAVMFAQRGPEWKREAS